MKLITLLSTLIFCINAFAIDLSRPVLDLPLKTTVKITSNIYIDARDWKTEISSRGSRGFRECTFSLLTISSEGRKYPAGKEYELTKVATTKMSDKSTLIILLLTGSEKYDVANIGCIVEDGVETTIGELSDALSQNNYLKLSL